MASIIFAAAPMSRCPSRAIAPPVCTVPETSTSVVLPAARTFDPDLVLVSAGFDAHRADPLTGLANRRVAEGAHPERLRCVMAAREEVDS